MTDPTHVSSADPSATTGQAESERERSSQILLYDGLCGFCNGTVQFILRHDPHGPMRFAPLQGPTATAVLARHPELEDVDSLILVEGTGGNETISTHSDAVLRIGGYLGGIWASSTLLGLVPRRLRDWLYRLIARHRYSVFGRNEVCPKPPVEVRTRFLP